MLGYHPKTDSIVYLQFVMTCVSVWSSESCIYEEDRTGIPTCELWRMGAESDEHCSVIVDELTYTYSLLVYSSQYKSKPVTMATTTRWTLAPVNS